MTVSVREVAAMAGVSVGTVSNVLNRPERVAPLTVERVLAAIDELGFVRNDAARQLRAGRSRSLGLLVLDVGNPFFTDIARGAEKRAAEAGLTVLVGNSDQSEERESAYLDLFEEQRVRGVLITPIGDVVPRLERLRVRGTPTVLVDREANGLPFSSVAVDDEAGGYLAVSHLLATGRRRIALITGPRSIRQVVDRIAGAHRAVGECAGARLEIIDTPSFTVHSGRGAGEEISGREASSRPDAVFAANDLLAMGALQALTMSGGIRVPQEIAIVGYDDIAFAESAVVPLSSVRQPSELIGYTAVDVLLHQARGAAGLGGDDERDVWTGQRNVLFQPELVIRESTSANHANAVPSPR